MMARLLSLEHMILIGAQISDMVRHIKCEMTMHIQIKVTFMYAYDKMDWFRIATGMFILNS